MMTLINHILTKLFGAIITPLSVLGTAWALIVLSVLAGMFMSIVFRFTSNQKALRGAADQVRANLLAIKLFQHDLGVTLRCQGALLVAVGQRLLHSLPPLLVILVPVALLLSQMGLWFEHRPLRPGEATVVEVRLREMRNVELVGAQSQTPVLRDAEDKALFWRVVPLAPGPLRTVQLDGESKQITIGDDGLQPVSVRRPEPGLWNQLAHPGEDPIAGGGPIRAIIVHQPRRDITIFGMNLPWWLTFLIVSCAAAYAVKSIVKVQF